MISQLDISSEFALDVNSVGKLRLAAKTDSNAAIKEAAKQFEAVFVNMMLKSMRDATPKDGPFDSTQSNLYTEFFDQQISQKFSSGGGIGLADMIVKQLTQSAQANMPDAKSPEKTAESGLPLSRPDKAFALHDTKAGHLTGSKEHSPKSFVDKLWSHAAEAGKELGIPAHFLIGHAALESGWGKREIHDVNGNNSHNLFGIKAGKNWKGPVVEATTTEYVNGVASKTVQRFRAYDSYEAGFRDYANLLRKNPRYAAALDQGGDAAGFAKGLQTAGYATDPLYANKLERILNSRVMRESLQASAQVLA